ncbi:MAG: IPT/TIG domain-containing protein [Thermoanaerobaculia bacterium]|nr:IPT/TIG domain-containing protein [Thermoanaerobaculia bacterium]
MLRIQLRALILLLLPGFALPLRAQLYELPFAEITGRSTVIVEGRVTGQFSFWDHPRRNICTANTVEIFRIYKGAALAPHTVQVITPGGIVGDRMHLVSESVQYRVGDAGLFCLIPSTADLPVAPAWENFGAAQGFFRYDLPGSRIEHPFLGFAGIKALREQIMAMTREPAVMISGHDWNPVPTDRATPVISSFSPTVTTAGTGSILTISGSNFGATQGSGAVRFRNANSSSSYFDADASDVISWSDTEITIRVPSTSAGVGGTAATGKIEVRNNSNETGISSGTLTIDYAYTNFEYLGEKYGAKLVEDNGDGGMTFTLSTSLCNSGDQDAINALGRALREWRCVTGVNWELSTSTTSSTSISDDGVNIITWDVSTGLPVGVLGRTTSRFWGCQIGSDYYWYLDEVDINLDEGANWYYCDNAGGIPGSSIDFQSVVFHEMGHGHQLGHVNNDPAVMHRSISNGQIKRTLLTSEQTGAEFIINQSANPCGPGPMTLLNAPGCQSLTAPTSCDDPGPCTAALPVELIAFYGVVDGAGVRLEWSTATEINNDHFTLERSADAIAFAPLVEIPGAAFSTTVKAYRHLDPQPLPGWNYYRLRQTDNDGSETVLGIIAVRFGKTETSVQVYPNPVKHDQVFTVFEQLDAGDRVEWMLTDWSGRLIARGKQEVAKPGEPQTIALRDMPNGACLLRIYRDSDQRLLLQELLFKQ